MSRSANPGELRTLVRFVRIVRTQDDENFYQETEEDVLLCMAKWQNVHGNEAFSEAMATLAEPATLTVRYWDGIRPELLVYKDGDTAPFEVISVDDVEDRHAWMEVHVKRQVPAR